MTARCLPRAAPPARVVVPTPMTLRRMTKTPAVAAEPQTAATLLVDPT